MDWSSASLWWVAAGIAVAVELATGTFYLLMFALGLAAAAVTAHLGAGGTAQVVVGAVTAVPSSVYSPINARTRSPMGNSRPSSSSMMVSSTFWSTRSVGSSVRMFFRPRI